MIRRNGYDHESSRSPRIWAAGTSRTPKNQLDKKSTKSKLYSDVVMKVYKDLEVVDTQGQCHGMVPRKDSGKGFQW